jgi:predicted MPP superfamily phosphohydrolase
MELFRDVQIVADGWSKPNYGQPGNRLYVNVGIGFSDIPIRINATPEVTFFRLRRG